MFKNPFGIAGLIAALSLGLGWQSPTEQQQEPNPYDTVSQEFTISARSDIPAVEVQRWGGNALPPRKSTLALYGDDRLTTRVVHTYETARGRDSERSVQLTHEDSRSLMKIAVEGGLLGLSWDDLQRKINPITGKATPLHDASWLRIRYRLDSYGDAGAPVDFTFECRCVPAVLRFQHPDVPELSALSDFLTKLGELTSSGDPL